MRFKSTLSNLHQVPVIVIKQDQQILLMCLADAI